MEIYRSEQAILGQWGIRQGELRKAPQTTRSLWTKQMERSPTYFPPCFINHRFCNKILPAYKSFVFAVRFSLFGRRFRNGDKPPADPFRNLDRDGVAERSVAGTVQPFGKPCKTSHSVGVSRRTDKMLSRFCPESSVIPAAVECSDERPLVRAAWLAMAAWSVSSASEHCRRDAQRSRPGHFVWRQGRK